MVSVSICPFHPQEVPLRSLLFMDPMAGQPTPVLPACFPSVPSSGFQWQRRPVKACPGQLSPQGTAGPPLLGPLFGSSLRV